MNFLLASAIDQNESKANYISFEHTIIIKSSSRFDKDAAHVQN